MWKRKWNLCSSAYKIPYSNHSVRKESTVYSLSASRFALFARKHNFLHRLEFDVKFRSSLLIHSTEYRWKSECCCWHCDTLLSWLIVAKFKQCSAKWMAFWLRCLRGRCELKRVSSNLVAIAAISQLIHQKKKREWLHKCSSPLDKMNSHSHSLISFGPNFVMECL